MTQNIYDDETCFAGYSRRLPRSIHGLGGAYEWPTLRSRLPERGLDALDLGCSFGWFGR
jgi:hypothetical protein